MWLSIVVPDVGESAPPILNLLVRLNLSSWSHQLVFLEIPQDSKVLEMKSLIPASVCLFNRIGLFYLVVHIRTLGSKIGSSASRLPPQQHFCVSISFFHPSSFDFFFSDQICVALIEGKQCFLPNSSICWRSLLPLHMSPTVVRKLESSWLLKQLGNLLCVFQ